MTSVNNEKVCPGCGKTFACQSGSSPGCWCAELPSVLPADADSKCLCQHCLATKIQAQFKANPEKAAPYLKEEAKSASVNLAAFEQGLDYYINDDGNWVFTTFYHLKKGYCCRNECKHCPYGFKKEKK